LQLVVIVVLCYRHESFLGCESHQTGFLYLREGLFSTNPPINNETNRVWSDWKSRIGSMSSSRACH